MAHAPNPEPVERAKVLISERRYQEAVRACRRALLSRPTDVELRLLLGEALLALERYDEVRVEMMGLARKAPERSEVHRILGEAFLRAGRTEQALDALRTAIALDPNDEIAKELISEAADENAPKSATIERWFADEGKPTAETSAPDWDDDLTVVPKRTADAKTQPSIQLPPQIEPPRAAAGPFPAPPRKRPAARPPSARPGPPSEDLPREKTSAARPSAMRSPDPQTSDFELLTFADDDSDDFTKIDYPEKEEFDNSPPQDSFDDSPTTAFDGPEVRQQIAEARTNALPKIHQVDEPSTVPARPPRRGVEAPNVSAAAGAPSPFAAPPAPTPLAPSPVRAQPRHPAEPPGHPAEPHAYPAEPHAYPVEPQAFAPPPAGPARPPASVTRKKGSPVRKIVSAIGAVLALGLLGVVVIVLAAMWSSSAEIEEIRAAAAEAGMSGDRAALESVLADIGDSDDPPMLALRARLLATLTFEHGIDRAADAEAAIAAIEPAGSQTDAAIASALLSMHRDEPSEALAVLSGLTAEGDQIAEAFRARTFVTAALGRWAQAEEAARYAVAAQPSAPRHLSLHALMRHRSGDSAGGLTLLDGVASGAAYPSVRITRARILFESGEDLERAGSEASAVLDQMSDRATAYERTWAHLIVASIAAQSGDDARATEHVVAARESVPPADEEFAVVLCQTLHRIGDDEGAVEAMGAWPEPPIDAGRRALLRADVSLAVGQLDQVEAALADAPQGLPAQLLRAQLLEARGDLDGARPLYEAGIGATGPERWLARVRLAAIELGAGQPERAVELLEPGRTSEATNPALVAVLARAYLTLGRTDDASGVVDVALAQRPEAAELMAIRGAVLLARGEIQPALESLRGAARRRPNDADLAADLGDAALLAGETEEAQRAYDSALAARAGHPGATVGLARLALDQGELPLTEQRLALAETAGASALEVERVRAGLFSSRGDGAAGIERVRDAIRAHSNDGLLNLRLGTLYLQAEREGEASRAFRQALRADPNDAAAMVGQAFVDIRRGRLSGARSELARAQSAAQSRGRAARLAPSILTGQGLLAFENADFNQAASLANEAIEADARYGPAHLLLASVAIEQGRDPVEHLRAAAAGHDPPPEAVGRLAVALRSGEEACRLAARYLQVAPRGYDAGDVRDVLDRCR